MPTIHCPSCNQSYDIESDMIGKKVQCAVCDEKFVAQSEEAVLLLKKPKEQHSRLSQEEQAPYIQNGHTSQLQRQGRTGFGTQNPGNPQQQIVYIQVPANQKSKGIYVMLGLFLGCFGIHDLYAGHIGRGVAHLVLALWFSVGFLVRLSRIEGDYAQYDVALATWTLLISWLVNIIWVIIELFIIQKDGKGNPME